MTFKPEMTRLFNKIDGINKNITKLMVDTAGIKAEFKSLNSRVQRHAEDIEENRVKIHKVDLKLAKFAGAMVMIIFIIGVAIKFL